MSILEPRPAYETDDPMLDAVLGLHSSARRIRKSIEEVAPPRRENAKSREASLDPLPEPIVALLLGIVSTAEALERVVTDASPPVEAPSHSSLPPSPRGSLWR